MAYILYGLGLAAVLTLMIHGSQGQLTLLEADFVLYWILASLALLACCTSLPCRVCRKLPSFLHLPCQSKPCG